MNGVREEAARWFARMRDAEADDPERSRFEAWLMSDPAHAREYSAFEEFWQRLDKPQGWEKVDLGMDRKREQRRRLLKKGLGIALLGMAGGEAIWWQWRHAAVWEIALQSEIGQARREILDDGSQLTLGAASAAQVSYSRAERRIALQQGEAAFDVVRDVEYPFIVEAGDLRVNVLGTRFAVTRLVDRTRISVEHGRVQIETDPFWRRQRILLQDGEVAELAWSPHAEARLARVRHSAAGAFAFERGFIDLQNANLAEIAATFSRYRQMPVVLAGSARSESRVTASVNAADIENFLRLLPKMASVDVRFEADGTVVLYRY
ncbi:MAG: FecR domain-containing protein [Zoogloeaceae bacterium]|nr:FecR domain-containing protein [Zoogloeaceae bacterium]